jgi:PKD repeat protein
MKRIMLINAIFIFLVLNEVVSQTTVVLKAGPEIKDAYVNLINSNTNYADYPNYFALALFIGGDNLLITRSMFDFGFSIIPPDAVILDAKLSLYFAINESNPYAAQMGENSSWLQRITENWDEGTVTWNNMPESTFENQVLLPESSFSNQDYENIDVTSLVQDMVSHPEQSFGFMLKLVTEEPQNEMCFASGDYPDENLRPFISITYLSCPAPVADFTYLVHNKEVDFMSLADTATSLLWDFGDGYGSFNQNPVHLYQDYGRYLVCLRVEDTCHYAIFCDTIVICESTEAKFELVQNSLLVNFVDSSISTLSWYWEFGDGDFSTLQNPVHNYAETGEYNVCLYTANGCSLDTICKTILVEYSDLKEIINNYVLNIFPNPTVNYIHIQSSENILVNLKLINQIGVQVFGKIVNLSPNHEFIIDLCDSPMGMYYLIFESDQLNLVKKVALTR